MSALRRIGAVAGVEVRRLLRARIAFTLLVLVPALQVVLFGTAIRPSGASVRVVVAAPAGADVATVRRALSNQPGLVVDAVALPPGAAEAAVRTGRADIGIEVPLLRSFANPTAPVMPVRVIADGADPQLTAAAAARAETAYWRGLAEHADAGGPGVRIERLYNADARADWAFLPALIGVTVMISMIMLGTLSLAREREGGTWEALLALPLRPVEALVGKLLPYAVIGMLQGLLVLAIGVAAFDLPARGSVGALAALLPLFALAHLALGYAVAARAATQLAALQGVVAFYLPAMLLSGFLYPFATLPRWAQILGEVFPLTHFIRAARGALLRGDGTAAVLAHGWPIAVFLLVAAGAAWVLQARRLD